MLNFLPPWILEIVILFMNYLTEIQEQVLVSLCLFGIEQLHFLRAHIRFVSI